MERTGKLADLTLVSKYYPVANYSYPRKDVSRCGSPTTQRSSLGSEGSAPGLVDDDSEISIDDDYQYHSHATEIWDSFWQPPDVKCEEEPHPKKQYPALLPAPHNHRGQADETSKGAAWPLLDNPNRHNRRAAASYSASSLSKPLPLPPRSTSLVPSWTSSRPQEKPQRPPRPDSKLLLPCLPPPSPVVSAFSPADVSTSTPITTRPLTPNETRTRPICPLQIRPSTSGGSRNCTTTESIILVQPSPGLPSPAFNFPIPPTHTFKSTAPRPPKLDLSAEEPKSFFDYDDSDDEEEEEEPESTTRFKFIFHKRAESEFKRSSEPNSATTQKRRNRAKTAPSSPGGEHVDEKRTSQGKKRQADYFHRMLGRRSR
ncbi:hypothetical protein LIA77_10371 [Sarocladium implicatum]|nr:hypothetical protein LIA77_10371 [Sarocladium implicatum]